MNYSVIFFNIIDTLLNQWKTIVDYIWTMVAGVWKTLLVQIVLANIIIIIVGSLFFVLLLTTFASTITKIVLKTKVKFEKKQKYLK